MTSVKEISMKLDKIKKREDSPRSWMRYWNCPFCSWNMPSVDSIVSDFHFCTWPNPACKNENAAETMIRLLLDCFLLFLYNRRRKRKGDDRRGEKESSNFPLWLQQLLCVLRNTGEAGIKGCSYGRGGRPGKPAGRGGSEKWTGKEVRSENHRHRLAGKKEMPRHRVRSAEAQLLSGNLRSGQRHLSWLYGFCGTRVYRRILFRHDRRAGVLSSFAPWTGWYHPGTGEAGNRHHHFRGRVLQ